MSRKEEYEQKTEELLLPVLTEYGFECVDVEYVKEGGSWYLRAYIDKPGGITLDDCEMTSRRLSDLLDEAGFMEDPYILEVSSPGLGRPLRKEKDFRRSIGEEIEIHTYKPVGKQKDFKGILKSFDAKTVVITNENGEDICFERSGISLVRLAFDF